MSEPPKDEDEWNISGFVFTSNFDSGNLARVELVPPSAPVQVPVGVSVSGSKKAGVTSVKRPKPTPAIPETPDFEFNLWTNPDCCGTPFENTNRTWFHFAVKGGPPFSLVKLNIVDLNKQGRMYRDGMAPVFRVSPGRNWERVRDKPIYHVDDNVFTLSFKYRTLESPKTTLYFAFTYPFSYGDLQNHLAAVDTKMGKAESLLPKIDARFTKGLKVVCDASDAIYYHRELLCHSLQHRRVDLITISSRHKMMGEREPRLPHLFPDENTPRCFKFQDKKVIFVSARVHPGETPSSFVLNGLVNLLVSRDDPVALLLRRQFVFKLIPMLNPDGVARGHYRTDTRGVNLNRFYLNPDVRLHPSIYAARALIRYYHHNGQLVPDHFLQSPEESEATSSPDPLTWSMDSLPIHDLSINSSRSSLGSGTPKTGVREAESGLFLYMDMHGHASKKGIFMYGNHLELPSDSVDCMLFPKLMSLNSQNFHFGACNFTQRNMFLRDKRDGTSREGSGRVAVLTMTGLVRSYTLECNYNTGRLVNALPLCARDLPGRPNPTLLSPPKYTPALYEEVGRAIGVSILDLVNGNPWSRIPNSEYHTLAGVREWLRLKTFSDTFPRTSAAPPKVKRHSQFMTLLRPPRTTGIRPMPIAVKCVDPPTGDWQPKQAKPNPPKQAEPRQVKRPVVMQTTPVRTVCGKGLRLGAKGKLVQRPSEHVETETTLAINTVSLGLKKVPASGEPTSFKQSPKRLKMSTSDGDARIIKEVVSDGASVSKPSRSTSTCTEPYLPSSGKKRAMKQQIPLKYRKSLEKRRTGEKKNKMVFKKGSKLNCSELGKPDRKRASVGRLVL